METYLTVGMSIAAYLIGSISFGYILAKKAAGIDIRKVDSKRFIDLTYAFIHRAFLNT